MSTIFESRQMTREDKHADKSQQMAKRANILFDIRMWKEKESPFSPLNKILKERENAEVIACQQLVKTDICKTVLWMNEFD